MAAGLLAGSQDLRSGHAITPVLSVPQHTHYTHSHTGLGSALALFFLLFLKEITKNLVVHFLACAVVLVICFKELNGGLILKVDIFKQKPLKVFECLVNPLCLSTQLGFQIYFNYHGIGQQGQDCETPLTDIIQQAEVQTGWLFSPHHQIISQLLIINNRRPCHRSKVRLVFIFILFTELPSEQWKNSAQLIVPETCL